MANKEKMVELMRMICNDVDNGNYNEDIVDELRNTFVDGEEFDKNSLRAFINKLITLDDIELGIELLEKSGALLLAFPELDRLKGVEQPSNYHDYDVYDHTMEAVKYSENDLILRLTMLLHDICKPNNRNVDDNGKITFHGHQIKSCKKAFKLLTKLGYPKEVCNNVSLYIRRQCDYAPTDRSFDRMLMDLGNDINRVDNLLKVKLYDRYAGKGKDHEIAKEAERIDAEFRKIMSKYVR